MDENKVKIKTSSGFEWEFDSDVVDDQELLDALMEVDNKISSYSKAVKMLLGEDGKAALYESLRNEKGRVPATKVASSIAEIFKLISEENKKIKN